METDPRVIEALKILAQGVDSLYGRADRDREEGLPRPGVGLGRVRPEGEGQVVKDTARTVASNFVMDRVAPYIGQQGGAINSLITDLTNRIRRAMRAERRLSQLHTIPPKE